MLILIGVITGAFVIFALSNIFAVAMITLYLKGIGWSEILITDWLTSGLTGPFTIRLSVAVTGILLVYATLRIFNVSWQRIGMVRPKLTDIYYALSGYAVYFILYLVSAIMLDRLVPSIDFDQKQELGFSTATTGPALAFIFISLVILPPIFEEILMRGVLFTGLKSKLPLILAALITSIMFAAAHLQGGEAGAPLLWAAAIDTFILSMVAIYLKQKSGSLWPCIGIHALKNLTAFLFLFIFKVQ